MKTDYKREKSNEFFLLYFETTRRCNLSCRYCMSRLPGPSGAGELTADEAKHLVLDEVKKYRPGAAVSFSGGEHLLRSDALEIIRYNASLGLWTFLNTNGLLLDEEMLLNLQKAAHGRLVVVLSFNSVDDAIHKRTRDDNLRTVMDASRRCEKLGIHYFYILTVSRESLSTLPATMEYLKRRQMPVLRAPFVTRGGGGRFPENMFSASDMERTIHPALTCNPLSYVSFTPFFASPELWNGDESQAALLRLGCQAGRSFAAVNAEGDISVCVQLLDSAVNCGNVKERPLSDVLENHELFKALRSRSDYKGRCGRCRYKMTCGGCRALAFYHTGDIFAEDPTCFFEPEDETSISPLEAEQSGNVRKFMDYIKYNEPWNSLFLPHAR